jgi:glycosyl transferase family 87
MSRLLDLFAERLWFLSRLGWGLTILFAVFVWAQLTTTVGLPVDVNVYWSADPNNLYPNPELLHSNGYNYSPAFELVVGWGRLLPFDVFVAIWRAAIILAFVWLAGPVGALVIFWVPVASEINAGNIQILLALAVVLSFRGGLWPATWAFVLLTKVTPGVGLLWFALRREWRALAVALGVTAAIAAVTFALWPDRWLGWLRLLTAGTPVPVPPYYLPFWPRIAAAVAVIAVGAWRGWRWPVVVGATLALPVFFSLSPSMLVGVLPFARGAVSRWAARRRESMGSASPALQRAS